MNLNQSVVVSAAGRPMFGVGGSTSHATHEFHGYVVSLEWDDRDGEPLMLIWSANGGQHAGVFGICLSSAGKYAEPSGRPTEAGLRLLCRALPLLGRDVLAIELFNLADVVMQFIPDLLRMPPAPLDIRQAARGGAILDIVQQDANGRTTREGSI